MIPPAGRMQLEPINIALAGAAGRSSAIEERLLYLEQRLINTERAANEVSRAYDLQSQRFSSLSNDLARTGADMADLKLRYEAALSGSQLYHQLFEHEVSFFH
ncbi:uncharacterized protein HaLaN_06270, partial [Haematococcus lacustris]